MSEVEALTVAFGQQSLATSLKASEVDGAALSVFSFDELMEVALLNASGVLPVFKSKVKVFHPKVQEWKESGVPLEMLSATVILPTPPAMNGNT